MLISPHRYQILSLVILTVFLVTPGVLAHPAPDAYDHAKQKWETLKTSPKKKKYREHWFKVIRRFEKIVKTYPDRPEAPKALYNIGGIYSELYRHSFARKDLESAVEAYIRLGEIYPDDSLADDAWYLAAEILREKLNDPKEAFHLYSRVVNDHPRGDMHKKALYWHSRLKPKQAGNNPASPSSPGEENTDVPGTVNPATVTGIRYWSGPEYTRVVIDLSDRAEYEPHLIRYDPENNKPPRLYLDISPGKMSPELSQPIYIKDGLLNRTRASQYRKNIVRVVLDINSFEKYYHFYMEDPFRIVVDIHGQASPEKTVTASNAYGNTIESIISDNTRTPVSKSRSTLTLAQQFQLKVKKIVIDPGHGGKDPGAVGPTGLYEKDVNLKVALQLREELSKTGFEVIMTRDRDVYVDLLERSAIANKNKADLFISIHANASPRRSARGIETYYLSPTTDPETMRLAAFENAMTTHNLGDLEYILRDLLLSSKIEESSIFAASVQKSIVAVLRGSYENIIDHGAKPGPFFVLVNTSMPAVLVEMSFVSNYHEEKRLRDSAYLGAIADSIARGVAEYVQSYLMIANWEYAPSP